VDQPVSIDDRVRADLVGLLYEQIPLSSAISALVATVLCALLWTVTRHSLLLAWWVAIVVLGAARAALALAYRRRPDDRDARGWERRFLVTLAATGATWGVGGWLIMPPDEIEYQAVVYFFLMGIVGGAVANYSAHVVGVMTNATLVFLPSTIAFALEHNALTRAMAFGSVVYLVGAYRAARALAASFRRSHTLTYELEVAREAAEVQARTDELTQMRNRRAFQEMGEVAVAQARRYNDPLALISLDIDHFKQVNDTWGHSTGDETLRLVALIVARTVRTSDIAARVGGEEFAILLPRASPAQAAAMAERLRAAMEKAPLYHDNGELHFTASFGVAVRTAEIDTLDRLVAEADKALYEAKEGGRNRVVCRNCPPAAIARQAET
jgi:diguanylate cyclase (GGDEF)-like protein